MRFRASVVQGRGNFAANHRNPLGWTVFQTTIPPIPARMLPLRLITPFASAIAALSLAIVGGLAPDAHARIATKGPAPALTVESKVCAIGPTVDERSATVVASAILDGDGARVSMKFSIQQRADFKAKWKSVPGSAKSGLGGWENGQPGRAGLRYTKTINGLAEGVQYRVVVDARGLGEGDKVVTKTARRYVPCTQPLFTATLRLAKVVDVLADGGGHEISVSVRNAGRLPTTDEGVVTIYDAVTRQQLASATVEQLKGGETSKVVAPLATCPGQLYITVQLALTDITELTAEQSTTIDCESSEPGNRQRR